MLETLPKRSAHRTRVRGAAVLLAFVLVLVLLASGLGLYYTWATGASGPRRPVRLLIPRGATGGQVAQLLKRDGVIRSTLAFRLLTRLRHVGRGFEAGAYNDVTTNMTVAQALDALQRGPFVKSVRAGFPEGLTVPQVAAALAPQLDFSRARFVRAATSGRFSLPPYLPRGTRTVEGFLFPDTYDFLRNVSAAQVVTRLLDQFRVEAQSIDLVDGARALRMSPYQVVIVASMIEREARFEEDRPKIAAVIYNRIRRHMALQIDATVEYALKKYKSKLTFDDLKVQSPYNTYLHTGLPPTPIASPGLASLRAALHPARANYLYYLVTDAAGHHYFTASYRDFVNHKNRLAG